MKTVFNPVKTVVSVVVIYMLILVFGLSGPFGLMIVLGIGIKTAIVLRSFLV